MASFHKSTYNQRFGDMSGSNPSGLVGTPGNNTILTQIVHIPMQLPHLLPTLYGADCLCIVVRKDLQLGGDNGFGFGVGLDTFLEQTFLLLLFGNVAEPFRHHSNIINAFETIYYQFE